MLPAGLLLIKLRPATNINGLLEPVVVKLFPAGIIRSLVLPLAFTNIEPAFMLPMVTLPAVALMLICPPLLACKVKFVRSALPLSN